MGYSQGPPKVGFVTESRTWGVQEYRVSPPPQVWLGDGTHGAGPLRVILYINNSSESSILYAKTVILHINSRLAREMGMTLTQDIIRRQLPFYSTCVRELGDGSLRTLGPHLSRLSRAARKGWNCGSPQL